MKVSIIEDIGSFEQTATSWNALAAIDGSPLLRHEWFMACTRAFGGKLSVVTVHAGGTMMGAAPLVRARRSGVMQLQLLGTETLCEPCGFLYRDSVALRTLVESIVSLKRPLLLRRVPLADAAVLKKYLGAHHYLSATSASTSPVLAIEKPWADFEAGISSSRRSAMRRARRRAAGAISVDIASPRPGEVAGLMNEVIRVEGRGWKGRDGTSIGTDGGLRRFFMEYSCAAARMGALRIAYLRIGSSTAAVQLALEHAGRYWVLKTGYDESWSHCSPGILLMHETIRHAFERRLSSFEFLGSDEPWIRVWTDSCHGYETILAYPMTIPGMVTAGQEVSRHLIRKMKAFRGAR